MRLAQKRQPFSRKLSLATMEALNVVEEEMKDPEVEEEEKEEAIVADEEDEMEEEVEQETPEQIEGTVTIPNCRIKLCNEINLC